MAEKVQQSVGFHTTAEDRDTAGAALIKRLQQGGNEVLEFNKITQEVGGLQMFGGNIVYLQGAASTTNPPAASAAQSAGKGWLIALGLVAIGVPVVILGISAGQHSRK